MRTPHQTEWWTGLAVAALFVAVVVPAPAFARQDPGTAGGTIPVLTGPNCALTRIGTQLTRCDSLTGAGVAAPSWVPEG